MASNSRKGMPSKVDKWTINDPKLDRRIKLQAAQKQEIIDLYKQGASMRHLARSYDVDRRLIDFIVNPERKERNLQLRRDQGGSKAYYNKEKNTAAMRKHRQYKSQLAESKLK